MASQQQQQNILSVLDQIPTVMLQALVAGGFITQDQLTPALAHLKGVPSADPTPVAAVSKKQRKAKDPNAPKRPPSAFFLFTKRYRTTEAEAIKGMKASDVSKLAGAAWQKIKGTEAAVPFDTEAARLKEAAAAAKEAVKVVAPVRADAQPAAAELAAEVAPGWDDYGADTEPEDAPGTPVQKPKSPKAPKAPKAKLVVVKETPVTPEQKPKSPKAPDAPKKVRKPKMTDEEKEAKKAAKLAEKLAAKLAAQPTVPSISLPYMGATDGCCHGIRKNHGLYTQCPKAPKGEVPYPDFCKSCAAQTLKNASGLPNCGTIATRGNPDWRAPSGAQPVTYMSFLQKEGNHAHVLADRSIAETEAAKFGWTIPAEEWVETSRRQGRPKAAKTAVVTDSSASESDEEAGHDMVAKLVAEAKASKIELGKPMPAAVDPTPTTASDLEDDDDFSDEPPLDVSPFTFEGVEYLIDKQSNEIYCTHTHDVVGRYHAAGGSDGAASKSYIEFINAESDNDDE